RPRRCALFPYTTLFRSKVDAAALKRHFQRELLLPFTLVDGLKDDEFARLIEHLPVNSPLQVYATNVRSYPYGSAAAHALGYVRPDRKSTRLNSSHQIIS